MWACRCLGTLANVTLVLNALVLVAPTHGIVGALVLVATTASRDVGLVLWSLPPHMVLCASVQCALVFQYYFWLYQSTHGATGAWCNWCMTALFSWVSNLRGQPAWQSRWILRTPIESLSFCGFLSFLTFMFPTIGEKYLNHFEILMEICSRVNETCTRWQIRHSFSINWSSLARNYIGNWLEHISTPMPGAAALI